MNPFTHAPSPDFLAETFDPEEWFRDGVWLTRRDGSRYWYHYELDHHYGYDGGLEGDPIYVPGPGVIVESGFPQSSFGNRGTIRLANGLFFHNNHMYERCLIPIGTRVKGGETIGHVGRTGHVGGPHNHKTMTRENRFAADVMVDPGPWLRELQEELRPMTREQMQELKDFIHAEVRAVYGVKPDKTPDGRSPTLQSNEALLKKIVAKVGA